MAQKFFKLHSNGKVCRVLSEETNTVGGKGFDAFVQIEEPDSFDTPGFNYVRWVAVCRGEFVEAPREEVAEKDANPALHAHIVSVIWHGETLAFRAMAEDRAHAIEQCENAYPGCHTLSALPE